MAHSSVYSVHKCRLYKAPSKLGSVFVRRLKQDTMIPHCAWDFYDPWLSFEIEKAENDLPPTIVLALHSNGPISRYAPKTNLELSQIMGCHYS